jgi:hypothetical protein
MMGTIRTIEKIRMIKRWGLRNDGKDRKSL